MFGKLVQTIVGQMWIKSFCFLVESRGKLGADIFKSSSTLNVAENPDQVIRLAGLFQHG
jgi:hypothetical protein